MLSVSAVLLVVFGLVLLVVGLALTPIWLPVAIMAAFLVWLLRR
jgi:integral membrane sensor domain MASE1